MLTQIESEQFKAAIMMATTPCEQGADFQKIYVCRILALLKTFTELSLLQEK